MTRTRDCGHRWTPLYTETGQLLGDDGGSGQADGFPLDGLRCCGVCEARLPEAAYDDPRDRGICGACWTEHDEMMEDGDMEERMRTEP